MPIDLTDKHKNYVSTLRQTVVDILSNQEAIITLLVEASISAYPANLVDGAFIDNNKHMDKDIVQGGLDALQKLKDQFDATGAEVLKLLYPIK